MHKHFTLLLLAASLPSLALEEITITSQRVASPLAESSFSLSVVGSTDIEQTNARHINELLNRAPGVWLSRGNGQEHLTAIRSPVLTGPGSCGAFYMAEDGIPLRAPGFCNVNQLFDVNTEQASRIEGLRGSGAAVHGGNALNGVVNVVGPMFGKRKEMSADIGPHGYSRLKLGFGSGRLAIAANVTHDDGYKDDSGFDQQKLSLRHKSVLSGWSLISGFSASNLNQETAGFVQGFEAYRDDNRKTENPNPEAFRDSFSARGFFRFEKDGKQITPYFRHTDMAFLQHFLPQDPLEENGQTGVGLQSSFRQSNGQLDWQFGFDADLTRGWLRETQSEPSSGPFPTGKHYDYEVDALMLAAFTNGHWQLQDQTALNGGLRYEFQHYDYDNRMIDGNTAADGTACTGSCRFSRPADRRDSFNSASAHFGVIRSINSHSDLVFNAARGFRAPQATELYRLQATQLNAELEPVEQDNLELGYRGNWSTLSLTAVLFWLETRNQILRNSDRENFNGGKTAGRGVELELDWRALESLSVSASYSHAKHIYKDNLVSTSGNEVDTAPRNVGNLSLSWRANSNLTLNLEWHHQGGYYTEPSNTQRYEGHDLISLRATQQIGQFDLGLRIHNLTDTDYADRADFAFGNHRYFIGEERAIFVSLGWQAK